MTDETALGTSSQSASSTTTNHTPKSTSSDSSQHQEASTALAKAASLGGKFKLRRSDSDDTMAAPAEDKAVESELSEVNGKTLPNGESPRVSSSSADDNSSSTKAKVAVKKQTKKKRVAAEAGKCKKHADKSSKQPSKNKAKGKASVRGKKAKKQEKDSSSGSSSSSSSDSSDSSSDSDSSSSEDSSSEEEQKRKSKKKSAKASLRRAEARKKAKKARKAKKLEMLDSSSSDDSSDSSSSESSDSSSESEESDHEASRRRSKHSKRARKSRDADAADDDSDDESPEAETSNSRLQEEVNRLVRMMAARKSGSSGLTRTQSGLTDDLGLNLRKKKQKQKGESNKKKKKKGKKAGKRGSTLEYKRVDQLWDSNIHNYKLTESAEDHEDEFDQYVFTVRRKFDWDNKYRFTLVDIKSKILREALSEVMKDVKSVSLVEDQPSVDPNMLFLYSDELRTHTKKTLKKRMKSEKKKKAKKRIALQIAQCKLLLKYIDQDYDETKKTLYPLLKAGNITFDLIWALFKPNTFAFTNTYGSASDPRCFKVDYANKESSFMRGEWYRLEGRYLEYDGKNFGLGDFQIDVDSFKGPRKITSLVVYPLDNHRDPEGLRKQLIERGKRFVELQGMNYRFHKGLAFQKKKKTVQKVNINGRVMIDSAIFRRVNPNYPISSIKSNDQEGDDDDCSCCGCASDDEDEDDEEGSDTPLSPAGGEELEELEDGDDERTKLKVVFDADNEAQVVEVPVGDDGEELQIEKFDKLPTTKDAQERAKPEDFTDEELMIASPVVLGFAFSDKLWLEFSLGGINDIEWNDGAFSSLVLPENQKSIVKALVSSHKFHAAETIDDVVQGKGRGLVFVLHGPPGVGKTLTAEGIAEFLRCPLYAVSAGELGTDSRLLEAELQRIMDIAHSWGAVLLLDEADVFLEKREVHDIHRNALVSIFLRLLEYFQGILFLTTNRVETFDDAFQSRIHVALRYEELGVAARKEVWKMFLEKVRVMEGVDTMPFKDSDFTALSRNNLNGRQIKNAVRTAQALAVNEKKKLSIEHIKRVLEVAESFDRDLKGGAGYMDAMRSYT